MLVISNGYLVVQVKTQAIKTDNRKKIAECKVPAQEGKVYKTKRNEVKCKGTNATQIKIYGRGKM